MLCVWELNRKLPMLLRQKNIHGNYCEHSWVFDKSRVFSLLTCNCHVMTHVICHIIMIHDNSWAINDNSCFLFNM